MRTSGFVKESKTPFLTLNEREKEKIRKRDGKEKADRRQIEGKEKKKRRNRVKKMMHMIMMISKRDATLYFCRR